MSAVLLSDSLRLSRTLGLNPKGMRTRLLVYYVHCTCQLGSDESHQFTVKG